MTRSSRFAIAAVLLLLFSLAAVPVASAKKPPHAGPTTPIQILGINDFHGQLRPPDGVTSSGGRIGATSAGGSEYLASTVRALEATNPNTLVVAAGDNIGATPLISGIFHDEPTIEALNLIGMDYAGVGNHEFDEGIPELLRMQNGGCHPLEGCFAGDGFGGADFQYLAANVTYKSNGKTIFPPYAIHHFQGVKVAIIGMTLEGTPSVVTGSAVADVNFHDEADTVNALVTKLKGQNIETFIVLLHEGGSAGALNETTVNQCNNPTGDIVGVITRMDPEIDLVVTGHTNWAVNCPNFAGTGIRVTGAASAGRVVTDVDLVIDKSTKDVVSATINNVIVCNGLPNNVGVVTCPTPQLPAAPDLTALVNKYGTIAAPIENEIIGFANAALTRTGTAAGESSLGDIIADAQLWATSAPTLPGGPAVIAFMNAGGIRRDINAGEITFGEAFEVQPFANVLVTMDMTGQDIIDVLQQQFTGTPLGNGILQISASLTYTRTAAGATGQAGDLLSDVRVNGLPINPLVTYRVTVNNFLAGPGGQDNFTEFANGFNRHVGEIDLEAFRRYIQTFTPINPGPQNRITFVP